MQSSPPQRASNGPPSPVLSEYSINLDALEIDSRSGASTPLPIQQVDRILSEDIDGPSDFTLNMEKWMRGGSLRKSGLPSLNERKDEDGELLPTPEKEHQELLEDERTASHHTPSNSPPKESPFARPLIVDEDKDDERSSDWDPYAEAQTPMPQKIGEPRQFLQPTVEEYYSELTPARPTSAHAKLPMDRDAIDEERSPSKSEPPQPASRASSPAVSPERSPVTQRLEMGYVDHKDTLEQQLESLHAKCDELQTLNATLNETINEERRRRKEDTVAHEAQLADFARRERDLTEMKDQSQQHREDFRREFSEMKERVRSYEKQPESHRQEMERLRRKHESEIRDLKAQLERERREHKHELRALEQDVELARQSRDDAEETARSSQEQLDEQVAEVHRLKMEIQQGEELREGIKEQLRNAKMENERQEGTKRSAENAMKDVETLSLAKDIEIERLKTEKEKGVEELREELEEAKKQLNDAQAKDREQDATSTSALQKELDDLRTSYNYAIICRDEVQDELTTTHQKLAVERAGRVADKEEAETVNANLHARISAGIRTREGYWRERVRDMEEERRVMVKALLRGWGREEMGFGVEDGREDGYGMTESGWQLYEYLYSVARAYENEGKGERRVEFADL